MQITVPDKFGLVLAVIMLFWVQQAVIFVIPVVTQRGSTGIKPPVLYPNDSLIKELKLSPESVDAYMRSQRVHQNNIEFLVPFLPVFLIAGLFNAEHAAIAGFAVWVGRLVSALGYWRSAEARSYGAWFHIPELYCVYLAGQHVYNLVTPLM